MSNGSFTNPVSLNVAGMRPAQKRLQKYIKYECLVRTSYAIPGLTHQLFYLGEPARQGATLPSVADNNNRQRPTFGNVGSSSRAVGLSAQMFLAQRTPPFRETRNVKRNLRLSRARTPAKNITAPIPLATPVPTNCHFRGEGNDPLAPRSFRAANPLARNSPGGSRVCVPFGYRQATANAVGYSYVKEYIYKVHEGTPLPFCHHP